jgi:hypothetical protein
MAKDLLLGRTKRSWGRGGPGEPASSGHYLVEQPSCQDRPAPARGPDIIGWSVGLMFATRILTGKWPWYWFGRLDGRTPRKE